MGHDGTGRMKQDMAHRETEQNSLPQQQQQRGGRFVLHQLL